MNGPYSRSVPRRVPSAVIDVLNEPSMRAPTVTAKPGWSDERQPMPSSAPACGTSCQLLPLAITSPLPESTKLVMTRAASRPPTSVKVSDSGKRATMPVLGPRP